MQNKHQSFLFMHKLNTYVVVFSEVFFLISSKKDSKTSTTRRGELSIDGRREYRNV